MGAEEEDEEEQKEVVRVEEELKIEDYRPILKNDNVLFFQCLPKELFEKII